MRIGAGGPFIVPDLQQDAAQLPFIASLGEIPRVDTPSLQGGYITVPNLLLTTLALFAAASTQRNPVQFNPQPVQQVQALQFPNLVIRTVSVVVAPVGSQQTASAPQGTRQQATDVPRNILSQAAQFIASAQSEYLPPIGPAQVEFWAQHNVTIRLPAVNPLPPGRQQLDSAPASQQVLFWDRGSNTLLFATPPAGRQQTDSAPPTQAVKVDQPPNLLTTTLASTAVPIPPGAQRTESAPPIPAQVQGYEALNILALARFPLPPGQQRTESAPPIPREVWHYQLPNATSLLATPLPPGAQQTLSAPIPAPDVQSYEAPNATLFIPIAVPLPVGQQWTYSAPVWAVPIGMSVGWTIPPDLLPPGVDHPPIVEIPQGGGGDKRRRFVLHIRGQRYLGTQEDFEKLVAKAFSATPEAELPPISVKLDTTSKELRDSYFRAKAAELEAELETVLKEIHRRAYQDNEDEDILRFL